MLNGNGHGGRHFDDRIVIVTGGASGIGLATCIALATLGASIVVVDVDANGIDRAITTVNEHSYRKTSLGLVLDVSSEPQMEEMATRAIREFGRIDVLVCSAGILRARDSLPKKLVDLSPTEWDAILGVNLRGTFLSNRAVLPTMMAQRSGQIVNISSTSGRLGRAYDSAYCASKFGVVGMSEALAEEMKPHGIKVHVIFPDAVDTPLWHQNGPIPRPADSLCAARVADLIVFLLSLPDDTMVLNAMIAPFRTRRHARDAKL